MGKLYDIIYSEGRFYGFLFWNNSWGFLGARSIVCNWGTDNVITVRNASSSNIGSSATNTIRCRGIAIV